MSFLNGLFFIEEQPRKETFFGGGPGEPLRLLDCVFGHHKENFWQVAESFLKARAPFKLWLEKVQTIGHRVKSSGKQKEIFLNKGPAQRTKIKINI